MKSSNSELARQLAERDERIAELLEKIRELGDEIKLLKNLSRRPDPKPRGEAGKGPPGPGKPERPGGGARNKGRGPRKPGGSLRRRTQRVPAENVPDGAVRGGFERRIVRDVAFFAEEVDYELEVWKLPGGGRLVAKMPPGVASGREQYGLGLKACIVMMQRKGQSTAGRIAEILNDIGLDISRRSVVRIPAEDGAGVVAESEEVQRAGMDCASWTGVDDTGARHGAANGYCTMVGNDFFTHFRSTGSKSRLNFLERPSAGEAGFLVNDAALGCMRRMNLPEKTVSLLAGHPRKRFSGADAWGAHLSALGIAGMKTLPDPVGIASEGGLRGTISEDGRIAGTVVPGDDAGQFNVGDRHALCWVHAERLVRKLPCSTGYRLSRVEPVAAGIWDFYADFSEYRDNPREERKAHLSARFDEVFTGGTGYASLDGLLSRLAANKDELLRVLDHPETPLHTNGAERDIRAHAARRKISFGTRSEKGRSARDGYLGAMKTCAKLGVPFRDYLASRFGVAGAPDVPRLADLVRARAAA